METLTTRDYLEFRDRLIPASGFQSAQLREIEILLGLDDGVRIPLGREGSYREALKSADGSPSPATRRVEARLAGGPSLKQVVYEWLARTPIDGPNSQEAVDAFLRRIVEAHRAEIRERTRLAEQQALTPDDVDAAPRPLREGGRLRRAVPDGGGGSRRATRAPAPSAAASAPASSSSRATASCRASPGRASWSTRSSSSSRRWSIWRQRHARMVERVIGRRTGTGGSAGVDYLDQTALRYRVFGDLWAVRSLLLRKPTLPPLEREVDYHFRVED